MFNAMETSLMKQLTDEGVTVHRFAPKGGNVYSPANLVKLQRLVSAGGYDIVHTHNTACQLFGALCRRSGNTRMVTTEHNTGNRRRSHNVMKYTDRMMYSAYDRVVCVSDMTLASLTEFLGESITKKCEVIPNGIDLNKYIGDIGNIDPMGDVVVTMVAGFRPQKDQDTAVRALGLLPTQFRLRLVGDGERIGNVKELASDLGVADRVEFLGFRDNVPQLLMESDIVLMSSHYEGLSLSSVEGMASGRPFVASDVPGLREVTKDAGLLFPEGDSKALADILLRLSKNPEIYAETAARCIARAREYDILHTADRYMRIYSTLASEK